MVGSCTLRWPEGSRARVTPRAWAYIALPLMVESGDGRASLRAVFEGHRLFAVPEAGFDDIQTIAITPAVVRCIIEHALDYHQWGQGAGLLRLEHAQVWCEAVFVEPELERLDLWPEHRGVYYERFVEAYVRRFSMDQP